MCLYQGRLLWFHLSWMLATSCLLMVRACVVVLHRTFECTMLAKFGCAKSGNTRKADWLSSPLACEAFGRLRLRWTSVVLLWLLFGAPVAGAASLPMEGDVEHGEVASDEPHSSLGAEFTFVSPGSFDAPLDFLGASEGQHGRTLSECVSTGPQMQFKHLPNFNAQLEPRPAHFNAPMKWPLTDFCVSTLACAGCEQQAPLERRPAHFNAPMKWPLTDFCVLTLAAIAAPCRTIVTSAATVATTAITAATTTPSATVTSTAAIATTATTVATTTITTATAITTASISSASAIAASSVAAATAIICGRQDPDRIANRPNNDARGRRQPLDLDEAET